MRCRYYINLPINNIDFYYRYRVSILDSEWNDECIDFTMMCVFIFFFVSVYTISSRNNASIFNFSIFFDWKVNIVGALGRSKFKIPSNFQKRQEKQKKN